MRRAALICLPLLLLAACGGGSDDGPSAGSSAAASSSDTPSVAPTSAAAAPTVDDPLVADQALVRTLYYDWTQTSSGGLAAITAFAAEHNHPQYAYTADECEQAYRTTGLTDSYSISAVPDVTTMAPDPGWALPAVGGRFDGLVPDGRTYILTLSFQQNDAGAGLDRTDTSQVHATILDGAAYFFQQCDPDGA